MSLLDFHLHMSAQRVQRTIGTIGGSGVVDSRGTGNEERVRSGMRQGHPGTFAGAHCRDYVP